MSSRAATAFRRCRRSTTICASRSCSLKPAGGGRRHPGHRSPRRLGQNNELWAAVPFAVLDERVWNARLGLVRACALAASGRLKGGADRLLNFAACYRMWLATIVGCFGEFSDDMKQQKDPEFFEFWRTMNAYATALTGQGTTMVLAPDSEFFKFFREANGRTPLPAPGTGPAPAAPAPAPGNGATGSPSPDATGAVPQ